jgi:hypothetical protein
MNGETVWSASRSFIQLFIAVETDSQHVLRCVCDNALGKLGVGKEGAGKGNAQRPDGIRCRYWYFLGTHGSKMTIEHLFHGQMIPWRVAHEGSSHTRVFARVPERLETR